MGEKIMITKMAEGYLLEHEVNDITFTKIYKREADAVDMKENLESLEVQIDEKARSLSKTKLGYVATTLIDQSLKAHTIATTKKKMGALQHCAHLKEKTMGEITNEDVVNVVRNARNLITGEKLRQGTLKILKATLKELFAIVADMGFQRTNLRIVWAEIDKIIKEARPAKDKRSLLKSEVLKWLKSPEEFPKFVRRLSKLLLLSSSRISEWNGCTWDKVSFADRTVYMDQMVSAHMFFPRLKMYAKPYTIEMCEIMYKILWEIKEENDALGDQKSDWLFPAQKKVGDFAKELECPYSSKPMSAETYRRNLKKDMKACGLSPIHIHGLRISSAT